MAVNFQKMKPKIAQAAAMIASSMRAESSPPLQGAHSAGYIDAGRFSNSGLRLGLDRDSTQGRRRRDCFRDFQNARTINHRLGQFVKRGQGGRPGARELNNLCCNGGCRPGLGRGSRRLDRNFLSVRNCCGVGSGMSLGRVQRPRDWNRLTELVQAKAWFEAGACGKTEDSGRPRVASSSSKRKA